MPIASDEPSLLTKFLSRLHLWKPARLAMDARRAIGAGDFVHARVLLQGCSERAPAWAEPFYLLSRCAELAGEPREAQEALLVAALERNPACAGAERDLLGIRAWRYAPLTEAWHLYHGGRTKDALAAFLEALDCTGDRLPEDSRGRVLAGIGWCRHDLDEWPESAVAFDRATQLEPALGHAHKGLGIVLYKLGRHAEAEQALLRALECEPRLFDALSFLGWCHYARGAYADAASIFRRALAGNAMLGDAAWGIAWSLWRLEDVDGAASAFQFAVVLEPGHPSVLQVSRLVLPDPRQAELAGVWAALFAGGGLTEARTVLAPPEPVPLVEAFAALHEGRPTDCLALLEQVSPSNARERWQLSDLRTRSKKALGATICDDEATMSTSQQHAASSGEGLA